MSKQLIITNVKEKKFAFKLQDKKVFSIEYCDTDNIVGNIYVGVAGDIAKNINAAFINFDNGKKGYYLIDDNKPVFLNNKNTNRICQGDRILIQVLSDKIKTKEYTVTSNISFTGKYVVITVGKSGVNISKKISDSKRRSELKSLVSDYSNDFNFIMRTDCNDAENEAILCEAKSLIDDFVRIKEKAMHLTVGSVVKNAKSDFYRIAKEAVNKEFDEVITDDESVYEELLEDEQIKNKLRLYTDDFPISKLYSLENEIQNSLSKRVWLNSGAYLIIEHTEALNVIDVNTGKIVKKGDREKLFYSINLEAAKAISKEIRKRNLSGIIIVDFINMKDSENNKKIVEEMKKLVSFDEVTTNVVGLTKLGLMEITRKRIKKPLYELL